MNKRRDYLVISDIHLGARKTTAAEIIANLTLFFGNFKITNNFDDLATLFIAGDLWDDSIQFSSDAVSDFMRFWAKLAMWCEAKQIELIVLEGTPKHDRLQGKTVETYTRLIAPKIAFSYIRELSIQRVDSLDADILFVPDECRETAAKTYKDVCALLVEKNLTQVDFAIMHGMFFYQLGHIPVDSKIHHESDYLAIVKNYISIGHIHVASNYERIYAQGSFDRLSHGEEDPKGGYYFTEHKPGEWLPIFMENKTAKVYNTIKLKGSLSQELFEKIKRRITGLPSGSYIRILYSDSTTIKENKTLFAEAFPQYIFSIEEANSSKKKQKAIHVNRDYERIVLNPTTLIPVLLASVTKSSPNPIDIALLEAELIDIGK